LCKKKIKKKKEKYTNKKINKKEKRFGEKVRKKKILGKDLGNEKINT
jgi:hypothetical protein